MKKLILIICLGLLANPSAYAAAAPEVAEMEAQMAEARRALDEAARRLAELHTAKYGDEKASKRAMLGILLGDGPMRGGVELFGVTPGGGAEAAGLRAGDKIVRIGDIDLGKVDMPNKALSQFMKGVSPGESVAVVYHRDDEEIDAVIVTQARSSHIMKMVTSSLDNMDFDFDFDLSDMPKVQVHGGSVRSDLLMFVEGDLASYFDVDQGVLVIAIPDGSQLKGGDVILEVDGNPVETVADTLVALGKGGDATVRVKRKGRNVRVDVGAGEFDKVVKEEIRVIRLKRDGGDADADVDVHVEVIKD